MPLLPDQEEEVAALHLIQIYSVSCTIVQDTHPALRNFIIIDILVLNY